MNAKELAGSISRFVRQIKPTNNPSDDAVINWLPKWFIEDLENSANMLRQQADRIAELEKCLFQMQNACIDLTKQSVEPVAWMSKIDNHIVTFDKRLVDEAKHAGADNWMPMYLHPVKELTYEDGIEECAQRAEAYAYMSPNFTALAEELRAILRKAQE